MDVGGKYHLNFASFLPNLAPAAAQKVNLNKHLPHQVSEEKGLVEFNVQRQAA